MYNKNQTNVSNSQNNTPIDSNQNEVINPNKLFSSLKGLRTFSLESDGFLIKNQGSFEKIGGFINFIGLLSYPLLKDRIGIPLTVIIVIVTLIIGCYLLRKLNEYTKFVYSNKTFYRSYRFGETELFKSKIINFSDIVEIGVNNESKVCRYARIPSFFFIIYYLIKSESPVSSKEVSRIDGTVEMTSIVYLTKNGKVGYFNEPSEKQDSNIICETIIAAIKDFIGIKAVVAKTGETLKVNKYGNIYKFSTTKITKVEALANGFMTALNNILITIGLFALALAMAYMMV